MAHIAVASPNDVSFLTDHDHLRSDQLQAIVASARVLLARDAGAIVGWLRWGMFWDELPFMNMLQVVPERRGQGIGRQLVDDWERRCSAGGHQMILTSTMSNESAQHFYRHLGFRDCGSLLLPDEPLEIILMKNLCPPADSVSGG